MMLFRSLLLAALAASGTSAADTCLSCDCFECLGRSSTPDATGMVEVQISSATCKDGSISWMCCTGTDGNAGACDVDLYQPGCSNGAIHKCNDIDVMTIKVPASATTVDIQAHDGQFGSTLDWNNDQCGGSGNGGSGSCLYTGTNTGICEVTVPITADKCGCTGSCVGDPHFKTWNDEWYDFHGAGDFVFLSHPAFADNLGLDIHIRTTIRDTFSFIEAAAIRIGTDILEVTGWGGYMLNGVDSADLPQTMGGRFHVKHIMENKKKHHFDIEYSEGRSIQVWTMKDLVTIQMANSTYNDFVGSVGLLGDITTGEKRGRDGHNFHNKVDDFGREWQVRADEAKLFDTPRFPQAPEPCVMPEARKETSRRLGVSVALEAAEKACAHWGNAQAMCVSDVLAMGDLEAAQAGVF